MKIDIAISTQPNWISQQAADREMNEIASNVRNSVNDIKIFTKDQESQLASWVQSHTNNAQLDILILCGVIPNSIYTSGNKQPDGSIAERFLEAGNMIINTGDYMFYIPSNGDVGLKNMMDLPDVTMWSGGAMKVITTGSQYLPSLKPYTTTRALDLTKIKSPWTAEAVFAQNDQGTLAEPVVVRDTATGGRLAIFYQLFDDNAPRGEVISEFILNWLPTVAGGSGGEPPAGDSEEPVAYWNFDEGQGTVVHDVAGSNDGIINGGPHWVNGYFGSGLEFDGTKNYVDCGAGASLNITRALTIAAWIKVDIFQSWDAIVTKGVNSSSFSMQVWGDGALRFSANWGTLNGAVGTGIFNSSATMSAGKWFHVAATHDGSKLRFYINGTLDSTVSNTVTFGTIAESLILGCDFPGGDEYFDGVMDEVRIYNRALTGTEVQQIMGGTAPPDDVTAPVITAGPSATSITSTSVVITWSTNEASSSVVEYGRTAAYGLTASGTGNVTGHSVPISSLSSNTLYYYRVISTDPSGNTVQSTQRTFTTAPASTPGEFVLVGIDPDDTSWLEIPDIAQVFVSSDSEKIGFKVTSYRNWGDYIEFYIDIDADQNRNTGASESGADYSAWISMEDGLLSGALGVYDPTQGGFVTSGAQFPRVVCQPNSNVFEISVMLRDIGNPDAVDFEVWMLYADLADFAPDVGLYTHVIQGSPEADRTLSITSAEGSPGSSVAVQLSVSDATGIAGGDILIRYDASILTVGNVSSTSLSSGITIIANKDVPGEIRLGMAGTQGIPSGSGGLVKIEFTVNANAQSGTQTTLRLIEADIYQASGSVIPVDLENGVVTVIQPGIKGDVNDDGMVRSNDAILALQIATELKVPTGYEFWAADMNDDGVVRSNDAILILNKAIGLAAPDRGIIAKTRGRRITVTMSEAHGVAGENVTVPLDVDNTHGLAGGDICIAYDPEVLRAVGVSSRSDVLLASNVTSPGLIRIAFVNTLGFSSRSIASIQFEILTDDVSPLRFESIKLYSPAANPLNSTGIDEKFSSWAIPAESNALLQNFPNPFNPETWIPYQLKEDSEVTIRIYSITGSLVRELELGHRSAGLYIDRSRAAYWDGKNEHGEKVVSGTYFCTIQAGAFTATRKMVVAK